MTNKNLKAKISMALKDPILQQGFEIICKENAQLTKAKELIKELSSSLSVVGECEEEECELLNQAEHFLSRDEFEND